MLNRATLQPVFSALKPYTDPALPLIYCAVRSGNSTLFGAGTGGCFATLTVPFDPEETDIPEQYFAVGLDPFFGVAGDLLNPNAIESHLVRSPDVPRVYCVDWPLPVHPGDLELTPVEPHVALSRCASLTQLGAVLSGGYIGTCDGAVALRAAVTLEDHTAYIPHHCAARLTGETVGISQVHAGWVGFHSGADQPVLWCKTAVHPMAADLSRIWNVASQGPRVEGALNLESFWRDFAYNAPEPVELANLGAWPAGSEPAGRLIRGDLVNAVRALEALGGSPLATMFSGDSVLSIHTDVAEVALYVHY